MDARFKQDLEGVVKQYKAQVDKQLTETPFGVPGISKGWGTSGQATGFAVSMYFLHKAFPELIGSDYTLNAINYLLGTHPVSNSSWISAVGTKSRLLGYGNNRAEFTFLPGGVSPGYVVVNPDLPEYMETWPFLWFENEYVVNGGAAFVLAANAADNLVKE
jgi:endoglucanase